jgi:5-methylcytosine-specific restriction endonuclease McrA
MSAADAQRYDQYRGGARARGYDGAWERARAQHLAAMPSCLHCAQRGIFGVLARVVDHVVPVAVDPGLRLDPTNLQSLCHPCHAAKSREDRRRWPMLVGRSWALTAALIIALATNAATAEESAVQHAYQICLS